MKFSFLKIVVFFTFLLFTALSHATTSGWKKYSTQDNKNILDLRLTSATEGVGRLSKIPASLEILPFQGWKTYWRSPGDAGLPTEIILKNSENVKEIKILWPAPHRFSIFGIDTFGYKGRTLLPLEIYPENTGEDINIHAEINILACKDICVPVTKEVFLFIPSGPEKPTEFARLRAEFVSLVPKKLLPYNVSFDQLLIDENGIILKGIEIPKIDFDIIVENKHGLSFGKPNWVDNTTLLIPLINDINGLKKINDKLNLIFLSKDFNFEIEKNISSIQSIYNNRNDRDWRKILSIVLIAFLGGLILNVMPCVFPVLALKLSKVLSTEKKQLIKIRYGFLFTALGIVLSFLTLSIILILIRELGVNINWGMQFQYPIFLGIMSFLILIFGINMIGSFEFKLPDKFATVISKNYAGYVGDFFTGFFATILSTPCSAPFVGTAISIAFIENNFFMTIIFLFMGLGLSIPWIIIAIFPKLLSILPKPGKWMLYTKKFLGFGLILTSIWLVSIIFPLANISKFNKDNDFIHNLTIEWELGLAEKLAKKGEVIIVDVTADWCLTCKINKLNVLESKLIKEKIQGEKVKFIQADWTQPNQAILDYLFSFRRFAVPFNVIYGPNKPNGILLKEILTVKDVVEAINNAS